MLIGVLYPFFAGCSSEPSIPVLSDIRNAQNGMPTNAGYFKSMLGLSDISSFDVYVDTDQIVHLIASGKLAATDRHTVIRYTFSEDGGHHWKDAVSIDQLPTVIAKRGNDIQLAANGRYLVAVWQTEGELPGMGPMVTAWSSDYGKTWRQGANPAANDQGNQAYIDVIADQHGVFHVIWLEDPKENGQQSLRHARSGDHGQHWTSAITLDDSTCSCCWNTLTRSSRNQLHVLYRDMVPRDMLLMQSSDGGLKSIESNGFTHLHGIFWTGVEGQAGLDHVISSNHGQSWSTPRKFSDMATNGDIAAVAGPHTHTIAAVWNEIEPGGTDILLSRSTDGGHSWSAPERLAKSSSSPTHPRLVAIGQRFLALWTEKHTAPAQTLAWYVFE